MKKDDEPTALTGTVARFKGDGRKLGYPTANLAVETTARDGVYFGFTDLGEFRNHPSLIFIGVPTTMGDDSRRVEAHLLDIPDEDYYGLPITIRPGKYHRANQTFDQMADLMHAMKADEAAARQWFRQNN